VLAPPVEPQPVLAGLALRQRVVRRLAQAPAQGLPRRRQAARPLQSESAAHRVALLEPGSLLDLMWMRLRASRLRQLPPEPVVQALVVRLLERVALQTRRCLTRLLPRSSQARPSAMPTLRSRTTKS